MSIVCICYFVVRKTYVTVNCVRVKSILDQFSQGDVCLSNQTFSEFLEKSDVDGECFPLHLRYPIM